MPRWWSLLESGFRGDDLSEHIQISRVWTVYMVVDYIITILNNKGAAPCDIHCRCSSHLYGDRTRVLPPGKINESWWPMPMHLNGYHVNPNQGRARPSRRIWQGRRIKINRRRRARDSVYPASRSTHNYNGQSWCTLTPPPLFANSPSPSAAAAARVRMAWRAGRPRRSASSEWMVTGLPPRACCGWRAGTGLRCGGLRRAENLTRLVCAAGGCSCCGCC